MTDSWRRSDKKVFEFRVSNKDYYNAIQLLPLYFGAPLIIIAASLLSPPKYVMGLVGIVTMALVVLFASGRPSRKYACGRLKITVDDEGMNFEWTKKVPYEKNVNTRILFKDVTGYTYEYRGSIFNQYDDTYLVFYNHDKELIAFHASEPIKWWNAKNDELAFHDFLTMKSQLLKDQNIFQLDWDRMKKFPLNRYLRKRKLRKLAEKSGKLSSN